MTGYGDDKTMVENIEISGELSWEVVEALSFAHYTNLGFSVLVPLIKKRILITNPVTLVALLRTVRIYWRQEETDRNSRKISEAARLLYERATVWSTHVTKIGKGLGSAVKAYNESVGSYEGRMRPMLEKLDELKVPGSKTSEVEKSQSTPAEIEENIRNLPGF